MKFPYAMLKDFVETQLSATEIGDLLTMAGFELEGIEEVDGDHVLDIKVMSNRGDGLSVFGLSREVLAKDASSKPTELYTRAAARFADSAVPESLSLDANVATIESDSCHRFAVRAFEGVSGKHEAPAWMQKRLEQAGMRSISLLVDLTNYVMLELGQPLHSFDRDKLAGGRIVVRHARDGEKLTTLNGVEHELAGQMMICDGEKPVGVPGVMGGLETEVTDATERLLLESANFKNTTVRKTRKQLGLATEASYRFERSVDPDGVVAATRRFTELLVQSAPGVTVSNIVDLYPTPPERIPVKVRVGRAARLLGLPVTPELAERYLSRLGMTVAREEDGVLLVTPPTWRPDIVREEDLVEEIGRVHGFDLIPEALPEGSTTQGGPQGVYRQIDIARDSLVRAGYIQIMSHSLRAESPLADPGELVAPRNPASPEHAFLRNSHLPGLADAAKRNGARDLHLFETGKVFSVGAEGFVERTRIALLSTGALYPAARQNEKVPSADFYSLKSAILGIGKDTGIEVTFEVPAELDERLHPTRQASILVAGKSVGKIGQIHPDAADKLGLVADTYLAELDFLSFVQAGEPALKLKNISRNPPTRRDIAIMVSQSIKFSEIESAIQTAGGELLEKQWLFDVYAGQGIEPGHHSLGIGLQFRKQGENFTDEEANQVRDRIVRELESLGATLR